MLGFRRKPLAHRRRRQPRVRRGAARALAARRLHLGLPVRAVTRDDAGSSVRTADGESRRFDGVVLAVHGDQALPLLADPTDDERRVLAAFRSTANETVLHTDERLLPGAGRPGSWNYRLADCALAERAPDDHLLPQPAPAPRHRQALLRDAEPHRRDRRGSA